MKRSLIALTIIATLFSTIETMAQKKSASSAKSSAKIEAVRVVSGVMRETGIVVRQSDWINRGKDIFEYRLASARIVDGRLEFFGSYREAGKEKADVVMATLIATNARSANPWPSAASSTATERRAAQQNQQRERGEVTEQTQSLHSAAETGSGCEVIFLRLQPPGQPNPLQIGVTLAHQDNEMGNRINQGICRVVRLLNAKENTDEALTRLNRLISRE